MAADFPSSLKTYTAPTTSDDVDPIWIIELQEEIAALETKIGVDGSAVTTSVDYKLKSSVVEETSDYTIMAAEMRGNVTFVNDNNDRAYNLPNPNSVGQSAIFECKYDTKYIRANAGGSQKFICRDASGLWESAAGGYVRTNEKGTRFRVQCVTSGYWTIEILPGQTLKGDE